MESTTSILFHQASGIFAVGIAFYLWAFFAIGLHELCHASTGWLVGFRPYIISVGDGPRFLSARIFAVHATFHAFPFKGYVKSRFGSLEGLRWKGTLYAAAGPLCDFLLFGGVYGVLKMDRFQSGPLTLSEGILASFAYFQVILIISNCFPRNASIHGKAVANDGKMIILYSSGRFSKTVHEAGENYRLLVSRYDPSYKLADSWIFKASVDDLAAFAEAQENIRQREYGAGVDKLKRLLGSIELSAGERAHFLDNMASVTPVYGQREFLEQALLWATEAHKLVPNAVTISGTLGSLLIENGSYIEGIALLEPLVPEGNDVIDRSISASYIAKAYYHLGEYSRAREWLTIGRAIGDTFGVLARIEAEIAPTSGESRVS